MRDRTSESERAKRTALGREEAAPRFMGRREEMGGDGRGRKDGRRRE
jgi:hypothetical protein